MAKCRECGKKGLFLRLKNGVCSECNSRQAPLIINAFGMTLNLSEKPDPESLKPKPIERSNVVVAVDKVIAGDGSRILKKDLPPVFDYEGMAKIDNNLYELTSVENTNRVRSDVNNLNLLFQNVQELYKTMPAMSINPEKLKFKFDPYAYERNYCIVSFAPMTKSGRLPNLPIRVAIPYIDGVKMEYAYDRIGDVARAEISSIEVSRRETEYQISTFACVYTVVAAKINGMLTIKYIYKNDAGKRIKLYDHSQAIH